MIMRKLWSTLCAGALAASIGFTATLPAAAAPVWVPKASATAGVPEAANGSVINVQERRIIRRHDRRGDRRWDNDRRWNNDRRWDNDGRRGYYKGYRGYSYYRPGYRRYGEFWYPAAAFVAGAVIAGALANNQPAYSGGNAHVRWCYDRYRSYRASDNTFQPYNGPRQQCYSPYD
jgi:hypothetical protein